MHYSNSYAIFYPLIAFPPFVPSCDLTSFYTKTLFREFMTLSLDCIPFDVFFNLSPSLHLDDVVHLGQTCRQLQGHLNERTLQRRVVEVSAFMFRRFDICFYRIADLSTCSGNSARP
jgi:hypothetical protein